MRFTLDLLLNGFAGRAPRVLDPATGDGRFLGELPARLPNAQALGVDVDAGAVAAARRAVPKARFVVEDALLLCRDGHPDCAACSSLGFSRSWNDVAPEVFDDPGGGGFDLVVGNPPYFVETRGHSREFRRYRDVPHLAVVYKKGADASNFFVDLAVRVLAPGGRAALILPAYWNDRFSAGPMRGRLARFARLLCVAEFDGPAFPDAPGHHTAVLVFQRREREDARQPPVQRIRAQLDGERIRILSRDQARTVFANGRFQWNFAGANQAPAHRNAFTLPAASVRQGLVANPPVVTRRHLEKHPEVAASVGDNVFLLPPGFFDNQPLTPYEQKRLAPFWFGRQLRPGALEPEPAASLLYLTRGDRAGVEQRFPNFLNHLSRFRPILEARRETRMGIVPWWALHWPRRRAMFEGAFAVVGLRKCAAPAFALAPPRCYMDEAVNFLDPASLGVDPPALVAYLNSEPAHAWFRRRKRMGDLLQIDGECLREIPLPASLKQET